MSKTPIYIGIDSGGTKTLGLACNQQGEIVGQYSTVGANPYDVGWERSYEIFNDCVKNLNAESSQLVKLCISAAGIGKVTAESARQWSDALGLKPSQLYIIGDAYAAHLGAFAGDEGTLVLAGTGAIMIARQQDKMIRVGGWGHILGDQGSGYGIALDAIRQSVIDSDLHVDSELLKAVRNFYAVNTVVELLDLLQDKPKSTIAGFVKEVLDLAQKGDAQSVMIIEKHFDVFRQQLSYLKSLSSSSKVSCTGGLFEHAFYRQSFKALLDELNLDFQKAVFTPVEAALQIAMDNLNLPSQYKSTH